MPKGNKLLLDTHVWVWLMEGNSRLGMTARETIQRAVPDKHVGVSLISVWEVALLENKGRLVFDISCETWVRRALSAPGVYLAQLDPETLIASTRLPGSFHGDPADRMIVAAARQHDATLVTADQAILDYAKTGHLHAIAAS